MRCRRTLWIMEKYQSAARNWKKQNLCGRYLNVELCKKDYQDCYLKLDVAFLACCSEYCRKLSYQTYRLDVVQIFTAPNMAKAAALRSTKARVEFMTKPEHLYMIEPSVRGGMNSVFETRYFNGKNRYSPGFNPQEPATFGFSVDAINLYGDIMQKEILPIGNFQFANEVSISEIMIMPTNSTIGYFVEVDFEYPASIRDQHKDYPPAPVKKIVLDAWLNEFQNDIKKRFNITQAKSFQIAADNIWNYVSHFKLQQLYDQLGMRNTKLHCVLQLSQEQWLEPYITLHLTAICASVQRKSPSYYKLMNNSVYGKTKVFKKRRLKVETTRNAERSKKCCRSSILKDSKFLEKTWRHCAWS